MTTRNILCAFNGSDTAIDSLKFAIRIAKRRDGWLTGVVRHGRPTLEARFSGRIPSDVLEKIHANDAATLSSIAERFSDETAAADIPNRSEFLEIEDEGDLALGELARMFDLVVTGVPKEDISASHLTAHPDMIALQSGRPVLVVPDAYGPKQFAEHAIVAWDGKRSAARALGDAMSLLEEKAKVTVLSIGKVAPAGVERLVTNIERHQINVEFVNEPRNHSTSQTILETTQKVGAQLIVMGAYEHSKFSHDLFGGPTTDVIANTEVPVFLSH